MAGPVDSVDLRPHLAAYGALATVVTVAADGRPHVGTSIVEIDGDQIRIRVGTGTAGHLAQNPAVCLTWPPPDGDDYQLIVDGTAGEVRPVDGAFEVYVTSLEGIRHRVAGAPTTGPSCLRLDE